MNKYTISAIKHATTVINGITDYSLASGVQQLILSGSGEVDPGFVGLGKINPRFTWTTTQIKTALANLGGIAGIVIATSNFNFWLQKITEAVSRAGNVHEKIAVIQGLLIPQTLTVNDGGLATISYLTIPTSADGTTSPFSRTGTQALDDNQGEATEAYTLGEITLNGAALDGVQSMTLNFGLAVDISGGKMYPTDVAIVKRNPSITINCLDIDETFAAAGWGLVGQAQDASDSVINLDDVLEGGIRGTTPITITIDEGNMHFENITGSDGGRLGMAITLTPTYDGTAAILALGGIT